MTGKGRDERPGSRGQKHLLCGDLLSVYVNDIGVMKTGPAVNNCGSRVVQKPLINRIKAGYLSFFVIAQGGPVKLHVLSTPPEASRIGKAFTVFACVHIELFRHTADVDTGASHVAILYHRYSCPEGGRRSSGPHSPRACTNDQ